MGSRAWWAPAALTCTAVVAVSLGAARPDDRSVVGASGAAVAPAGAAAPVRVSVPSVGIDANLVPLAPGGTLPPGVSGAGWYADGPAPGEPGAAVIVTGSPGAPGPSSSLRDVEVGDLIEVVRDDGSVLEFVVEGVAQYPRSTPPTGDVVVGHPEPALRLLASGGAADRRGGTPGGDVVVYASLSV